MPLPPAGCVTLARALNLSEPNQPSASTQAAAVAASAAPSAPPNWLSSTPFPASSISSFLLTVLEARRWLVLLEILFTPGKAANW